jgi:hypothetical protein
MLQIFADTCAELMNRRYKVYLSDLEKTVIYAVSHEVAQHATIAGASLFSFSYTSYRFMYFCPKIIRKIIVSSSVWP